MQAGRSVPTRHVEGSFPTYCPKCLKGIVKPCVCYQQMERHSVDVTQQKLSWGFILTGDALSLLSYIFELPSFGLLLVLGFCFSSNILSFQFRVRLVEKKWSESSLSPGFPILLTSCVSMIHLLQLTNQYQHTAVNYILQLTLVSSLCVTQVYGLLQMQHIIRSLPYHIKWLHALNLSSTHAELCKKCPSYLSKWLY